MLFFFFLIQRFPWGAWRGGWIGNSGSAMVVYQLPEVGGMDAQDCIVSLHGYLWPGLYHRLCVGGVYWVSSDGSKLERIDAAAEPYVPRNVYLYHTVAEDMYSAGVQLNPLYRFVGNRHAGLAHRPPRLVVRAQQTG